jgi:hypothetical protein
MMFKEFHDKKKALAALAKANKVVEIVNYNEIVDMINDLTKV